MTANLQSARIISGGKLDDKALENTENFFNASEADDKKKYIAEGYKIPEYWKNVIMNSDFSEVMSPDDVTLLGFLDELSSTITNEAF